MDNNNEQQESTVFIKWVPLYETRHKLIDSQHKELVNIVNELYLATVDNNANTNEAFIKAIKKCIDYTQYHFKTEEKIMDLINYSDAENHKAMHKSFYLEIVDQIRFIKFLKDWLLEHIGFQDKKFVNEIKEALKKKEANQ